MHTPITEYRTWIEISRAAIKHNYQTFRGLIEPKTKLMAVVKSNAYGHELIGFAKATAALGVDLLGVDSITEAKSLREAGIKKPILFISGRYLR
jgi:alanine racemase